MLLSVLPSSVAFFSIFFFSDEGIRIDVATVLSAMLASFVYVLILVLFVFTCKLKKEVFHLSLKTPFIMPIWCAIATLLKPNKFALDACLSITTLMADKSLRSIGRISSLHALQMARKALCLTLHTVVIPIFV